MIGRAVVIGAGIAGLTAALALRRVGWEVLVLERAAALYPAGAGLSLAPNAMSGLDAIGVGEAVRSIGIPTAAASSIRRPDGRYLVRTDQAPETLPLRAFERSALQAALLRALPATCLRLDANAVAVTPDGAEARLSTGETIQGDIVVAADGIHSEVRRGLWPHSEAEFLNYTVWVGLADVDRPVGPGRQGLDGSMTLGVGRYFLLHPVGERRLYWALGERADRAGLRSADELQEVSSRVGNWHDPIPSVLSATPAGTIRRLDIREVPALPTYVHGRVALVGDAAHAMSPDRGQGAGQGIEDAVTLAALLAEHADVAAALSRYDSIRRPRSQMVVRDAHRVGQTMVNGGPMTHWLMCTALRMMPAAAWTKATRPDGNPIWNWRPPALPLDQGQASPR